MSAADTPRTPYPSPEAGHVPLPLLRQYAAGTLPAREQHRVEAHTLACSRCADILDGLLLSDAATVDRAVVGLRGRLRARVGQAEAGQRPLSWQWQPLAAAAVLLITLGSVVFFWLNTSQPSQEAVAVATASQSEIAASAPAVARAEPPTARAEMASPGVRVGKSRVQKPALRGEDAVVLAQRLPTPVARPEASAEGRAEAVASAPAAPKPAAPTLVQPAASVLSMERPDSAGTATRLVRGRVTDAEGQALPGAVVQASGTTRSAATAADGTFALQIPASARQLTVSSLGYQSRQQLLSQDTAARLALALRPDSRQLSEVVVARREKAPTPAAVEALPAGGYAAFNQYLKDSLDYPQKALNDRTEGTVKLRFTVAADGALQDISVIRKVSEEIDAEAVRLLREGPKWFPAIRNGRRVGRAVELSVPFRLADQP